MVRSITTIPDDIVYIIIDNVSADPHTLNQCSLVSRAFLSHSHKHIFSTIQLDHPKQCRGLYRVLTHNPGLACYIRNFTIIANVQAEFRGRNWVTIENTLPGVLPMLHNLQSVTIRNLFERPLLWDALPTELRFALLDLSSTAVSSMTLDHLRNWPIAHFSQFVHLRRLHFLDMSLDIEHLLVSQKVQDAVWGTDRKIEKGHLESLEIETSTAYGGLLIDALTHPRSSLGISRLQRVTLHGACNSAKAIMCASSHALKVIVWKGLGEPKDGPFLPGPTSLGIISNLHTLVLHTKFARNRTFDPLPWLSHTLATTTVADRSLLEDLTIFIDFYGVWRFSITQRDTHEVYEYPVWRDLDDALMRPGVFTRLSRVKIGLRIGGGVETFKLLAAKKMPRLMAAGILHMVYSDK